MSTYIHFTEEQKEQARQTELVELLRSQGEKLKPSGHEYEWRDGSAKVTVRGNLWFHQYEEVGGDAIDFVRRFYNKRYHEAIGDCDYQLFLGCNDAMTAEFISDQCGEITVRVNNSMLPMMPLFSPVLNTTRPFTQNKTSTGRPLMMPDEVRRLQKDKAILLVRGAKPLLHL